jgi:hypothetical protein
MAVLLPAVHEGGDDVHRDGEHDRAVLLSRDVVQGLQISQLKNKTQIYTVHKGKETTSYNNNH